MRHAGFVVLLATLVVIAIEGSVHSSGEQLKDPTDPAEAAKASIVPVVVLKPGERQELFPSTTCTVGITRAGGLNIRELGGQGNSTSQDGKVCGRNGVSRGRPIVLRLH